MIRGEITFDAEAFTADARSASWVASLDAPVTHEVRSAVLARLPDFDGDGRQRRPWKLRADASSSSPALPRG